jgi:hypothetical protein
MAEIVDLALWRRERAATPWARVRPAGSRAAGAAAARVEHMRRMMRHMQSARSRAEPRRDASGGVVNA